MHTITPNSELSPAARQRGRLTLLAATFFMWGGFFMVIPLLSVQYVDKLGWAAASIGLVLAVRQLLQQGTTPFCGMLADRFGAKWLICLGLLLRAVGFATMAWATTFPLLLTSAIIAALGGGLFESPKSAAIAALTDEADRARYFSLTGVVSGLGVTLGTQLGALLLRADWALVAWSSAACFFMTFLVTAIFLPAVKVASEQRGLTYGFGLALRDRQFMRYNILLLGFWFMWVQFSLTLPLVAKGLSGTANAVSWMYGINAGMNVLLQYPILRLAARWLSPLPLLVVGMILMALGMGSVALADSVPLLLGSVLFISTGTLLAMPNQQAVTANLANPATLGSYYGVNALALAFGGGIGNWSGGMLYDLGRQWNASALPWLIFCGVGLVAAAGLGRMAWQQQAKPRPSRPEPSPVAGSH